MKPATDDFLPLAPATLHILLSLAAEKMYGYAIMQEVSRQSEGRVKLGPGTLYDNLQRLMKQGLVEEVAGRSEDDNSRRRYYRLTGLGRGVLAAEIDRLREVVDHAQAQLKSLRPRRA
jgi:DNA-binding PadR family transcriptional regulator